MKKEIFTRANFTSMDSMHDSVASSIQLENEYLIITYNNLDKGV